MAEFKKLSEVEQLEAVSENASVLVEEDGDIKRVPASAVGGSGGGSDNRIIFHMFHQEEQDTLFECNKTYDELWDLYDAQNYEALSNAILISSSAESNEFSVCHLDGIRDWSSYLFFTFAGFESDDNGNFTYQRLTDIQYSSSYLGLALPS